MAAPHPGRNEEMGSLMAEKQHLFCTGSPRENSANDDDDHNLPNDHKQSQRARDHALQNYRSNIRVPQMNNNRRAELFVTEIPRLAVPGSQFGLALGELQKFLHQHPTSMVQQGNHKRCSCCAQWKPLEQFDGRASCNWCRPKKRKLVTARSHADAARVNCTNIVHNLPPRPVTTVVHQTLPGSQVTWMNTPAPIIPASARQHWAEQTAARRRMLLGAGGLFGNTGGESNIAQMVHANAALAVSTANALSHTDAARNALVPGNQPNTGGTAGESKVPHPDTDAQVTVCERCRLILSRLTNL